MCVRSARTENLLKSISNIKRPWSDNVFLGTNICIYSFLNSDGPLLLNNSYFNVFLFFSIDYLCNCNISISHVVFIMGWEITSEYLRINRLYYFRYTVSFVKNSVKYNFVTLEIFTENLYYLYF